MRGNPALAAAIQTLQNDMASEKAIEARETVAAAQDDAAASKLIAQAQQLEKRADALERPH